MKRFDAMCGGFLFLIIIAFGTLGGGKGDPSGSLLAVGFLGVMAVWLLVRVMLIFFHLGRCVTRDVAHLARGGTVATLPQHMTVRPGRLQPPQDFMERLCWESGWLLVSRENDRYTVRSGDHTTQRHVHIRWNPNFCSAVFCSWLPVRFPLQREAPGLYAHLMLRNRDLHWSSWSMDLGESCEAVLCVAASLPTESLNTHLFARVCQEIAGEINAFHAELRSKVQYGLGQAAPDTSYLPPPQAQGGVPMRRGDNLPGIRYTG